MAVALESLNRKIDEYVESKPWSLTTKSNVKHQLKKIYSISIHPEVVESTLLSNGYSKYSVKTYFILASGFDVKFKNYYENRKNLFRNAYKTKTKSVTEADVQSLLDSAGNLYNIIYLMAYCGLRLSEALKVKYSDEVSPNILSIIGKGNKQRFVPCNMANLKSFSSQGPEELLAKDVKVYALRSYLASKNITPHDLRAFFITKTTRSRVLDLDEVAVVVGHSSISTTQRYLRQNIDEIARKLFG